MIYHSFLGRIPNLIIFNLFTELVEKKKGPKEKNLPLQMET